jgi:hypothetical protein
MTNDDLITHGCSHLATGPSTVTFATLGQFTVLITDYLIAVTLVRDGQDIWNPYSPSQKSLCVFLTILVEHQVLTLCLGHVCPR